MNLTMFYDGRTELKVAFASQDEHGRDDVGK